MASRSSTIMGTIRSRSATTCQSTASSPGGSTVSTEPGAERPAALAIVSQQLVPLIASCELMNRSPPTTTLWLWAVERAPAGALADRDYGNTRLDPDKARDLINAYRKEKGLKPLRLNAALTEAAKAHSKDLAKWDQWVFFFAIVFSVSLLIVERDRGTLAWSLSKPLSRRAMLAGKWIGAMAVYVPFGIVLPMVVCVADPVTLACALLRIRNRPVVRSSAASNAMLTGPGNT